MPKLKFFLPLSIHRFFKKFFFSRLSKDSPNRIGQSFFCQQTWEKKKKGWNTLPTKAKPYTSFIYAQQRIISFKKKPFVSNKRENSRELCVDQGGWVPRRVRVCTQESRNRKRKNEAKLWWALGALQRKSTDGAQRISTCPNPPLFSFSALRPFPWREVIFQMNRELLKLNLKNKPKNPKIKINQKMALRRITTRIDPHHHHHTNFFDFYLNARWGWGREPTSKSINVDHHVSWGGERLNIFSRPRLTATVTVRHITTIAY